MKHDESPTTFEFNNEEDKAAGPCGRNVVTMTKIHSPISLTVCIFGIIIGSIAFAFPEIHRNSLIHKEMFKTYERLHYYKYRLGYKIVCGSWIFLQTLHGVTIVLTIVGIKVGEGLDFNITFSVN
uniref:CNNM transmembrane domain-containing protein n=1 Tax=Rhabditophanes sp. KR3021 TaxID=114890 RepID=A0AC35TJR5_9BILA